MGYPVPPGAPKGPNCPQIEVGGKRSSPPQTKLPEGWWPAQSHRARQSLTTPPRPFVLSVCMLGFQRWLLILRACSSYNCSCRYLPLTSQTSSDRDVSSATLTARPALLRTARPVFPRICDQCRRRPYLVRAPQWRYAVARSPCRDASRLLQLLTAARASHAAVLGMIAQPARGPRHQKARLRVRLR